MTDIIVSGVLVVFGGAGLLLTNAAKFGFMLLVGGVWLGWAVNRRRRNVVSNPKNLIGRVFIAAVVSAMGLSTPPMVMDSGRAWQLPLQKTYMDMYRNTNYPDYFPAPEEVREHHGAYRMSYLPGFMQGTGHITVSFTADKEYVQSVAERFSAQAENEFPLLALTDESRYYSSSVLRDGRENAAQHAKEYVSPVPKNTNLFCDPSFEKYFSDEAVVYILSDNRDMNHPHSAAVIVDEKTGAVEFTKYG